MGFSSTKGLMGLLELDFELPLDAFEAFDACRRVSAAEEGDVS